MKIFFFLFISIFIISCSHESSIPKGSRISAKYKVFNEFISPKLNVCPNDTLRNFKDIEGWECMFKLNELVFEVEYKIDLGENGHMTRFSEHTITKDIDFRKFGITKDTIDSRKLKGTDIFIKLSDSRNEIIDGKDTLKIDKVFPEEQLIFVKEKNKNGRRDIYEYKLPKN